MGAVLGNAEDDAAVGNEVEGTVVVDFADEVVALAAGAWGDGDGDRGGFCLREGEKSFSYLRLLPPEKIIGVKGELEIIDH